jgi:hypothetical protein
MKILSYQIENVQTTMNIQFCVNEPNFKSIRSMFPHIHLDYYSNSIYCSYCFNKGIGVLFEY